MHSIIEKTWKFKDLPIVDKRTQDHGRGAALEEGNPEFATVLKVIHAFGLRLHATAA